MYRYTNVKVDIFEKEFFFLQKGVVVGCFVFKEAVLPTPLTIRSILSFQNDLFIYKLLFSEGKLHQF